MKFVTKNLAEAVKEKWPDCEHYKECKDDAVGLFEVDDDGKPIRLVRISRIEDKPENTPQSLDDWIAVLLDDNRLSNVWNRDRDEDRLKDVQNALIKKVGEDKYYEIWWFNEAIAKSKRGEKPSGCNYEGYAFKCKQLNRLSFAVWIGGTCFR